MNYTIRASVETRDLAGNVIDDVESSWEATMTTKHPTKHDALASLLGDGKAKVEVTLSDKVGGPAYSSTTVYVTITLSCNQDEKTVMRAASEAQTMAASLLSEYIEDASKTLLHRVEHMAETARKAGY